MQEITNAVGVYSGCPLSTDQKLATYFLCLISECSFYRKHCSSKYSLIISELKCLILYTVVQLCCYLQDYSITNENRSSYLGTMSLLYSFHTCIPRLYAGRCPKSLIFFCLGWGGRSLQYSACIIEQNLFQTVFFLSSIFLLLIPMEQ